MSTARHILALLRSHVEGEEQQFYSAALQMAAHEARLGHGRLAQEIRELIDQAKAQKSVIERKSDPIPLVQPKGDLANLVSVRYPDTRLSDMILPSELAVRLKRVLTEQRQGKRLREYNLTPRRSPEKRLFERMSDTSCSTALASYMAARILAEKPNYWPETIRALIVHSAEWTPAMQEYLKSASSQRKKTSIIRRYGYGVPNLERALRSTNNDLTLIIEDQVKPFVKGSSKIKTNEMNFHTLPWPTEELEKLGESIVELKVTLSYFIEPNPGERGWTKKHSYASHGLRFKVKRPLESNTQFKKRINKEMREEDEKISSTGENDNWFLGENLRNKGSLHSDRWTGTAVELAEREMIGVFPIGGWWKEKKYLERYDQTVRYSLIITIRVPEIEIECDLYTPVSDQIKASQEIKNKQDISTATEIEN